MTITSTSPVQPERVDARPILPRDPSSVWSRAAEDRKRVQKALEEAAAKYMPQALVIASNEGIYPIWVSLDHWFRTGSSTERVHLSIDIIPRPHRKYPLEYRVTVVSRGRPSKTSQYGKLDSDEIARLITQLSIDNYEPDSQHRLRTRPWILWRRGNPLVGIARDVIRIARFLAATLAVVALLFSAIGATALDLIDQLRQTLLAAVLDLEVMNFEFWQQVVVSVAAVAAALYTVKRWPRTKIAKVAVVAVALVCFVLQPTGLVLEILSRLRQILNGGLAVDGWMFWLALLLFAGLFIFDRRRLTLVYNEGRPPVEPRTLSVADYWHVVLDGIGSAQDQVRERFLAAFDERPHPELRLGQETLVSLGPDGKEEREQIVLSLRRAVLFCQFYPYGRNLYVGWDAYLNLGQWREHEVGRGMQSITVAVSIRSVEPSVQAPSEYDLHDLNCLIEWAHSRLVKLVRAVAAEHALDQELDFAIQRVERESLMSSGDEKEARKRSGRVQRTG